MTLDLTNISQNRLLVGISKTILTLVFLSIAGFYIWLKKDEFRELDWPSAAAVLLVAAAFIINVALVSLYNLITTRRLGAHLTLKESFMLSAVVAAGNFLLPVKAGTGLRAVYMKRVHDFPISYFASGAVIFFIVTVFSMSLAAVCLLFAIYLKLGYFRVDLSILFPFVMIVSAGGVMIVRPTKEYQLGDDRSWLDSFRGSLLLMLGERKLVLAALAIVTTIFIVASLAWSVALREFAPNISVLEALLLAASQIIAGFVTLTPGATGFQELVALYVGKSFAATTTEIFAVLLWVRVVRVAVAIMVAIPSAIVLRRKLRGVCGTN
jgi:uncharacterized membrane protein YbhN (UPF0104 family)